MSDKNGKIQEPILSCRYLDKEMRDLGVVSTQDQVDRAQFVQVTIDIRELAANRDLGTAIIRGYMEERIMEITRAVVLKRKAADLKLEKVITPTRPSLQVVTPGGHG